MKNLTSKFIRNLSPIMAILVMVLGLVAVSSLALPHKASAQFIGSDGLDWGGSGDDGGGFIGSDGLDWGGSGGYGDTGYGYGDTGYSYNDPCDYGCGGYDDSSGYDCNSCNSYDDYGQSYDYGCDYGCSSYGGSSYGCNTCSTPSYSTRSTPSYSAPASTYVYNTNTNSNHNTATSNSSSSANAVNNNTNPINIVVNVPPTNNNTNPPVTQNLTAYCVANPSSPLIGNQVSWQASASGGNGGYSYSWSGDASGSGQTVYNTYYSAGTRNAYLTVYSNGQQVSASCSVNVQPNGSTVSGYSVYQQPLGTPSAGVFLSQIPATGINPTLKMALFVLGLFAWSAFGAYMILEKRKMGTLATVGVSASAMDLQTYNEAEIAPVTESMDLEDHLSFRARENDVLISRDGIAAIMARSGNDKVAAESVLNDVISKVSRNEGNYAALNGEKVNSILNG